MDLMRSQSVLLKFHLYRYIFTETYYLGRLDKRRETIKLREFSVIFSSLESLLGNGRWRNIMWSDVYKKNLIAVVVDKERGLFKKEIWTSCFNNAK